MQTKKGMTAPRKFEHDLNPWIKSVVAQVQQEYPGQKFTVSLEMRENCVVTLTILPEE